MTDHSSQPRDLTEGSLTRGFNNAVRSHGNGHDNTRKLFNDFLTLLLKCHYRRLEQRFNYLKQYGVKPDQIDDIIQEVLKVLWEKIKSGQATCIPNRDKFFKDVGCIAFNVMRDRRRRANAAKRSGTEEEATERLEAADSEDEQNRQLQETLDDIEAKLKEQSGSAETLEEIMSVLLKIAHGVRGYKEISTDLDLSVRKMKMIRSRIRLLSSSLECE